MNQPQNQPKLSSKRVHEILEDSLFREGEDTSGMVKAQGIMNEFGFHPERLLSHKDEIHAMLLELPDEFHAKKGGGMSFLNACMDRHGNHWAELHRTMDMLFSLGIAIGKAKNLMPRDMWQILPGGMPYFQVVE